MPSERRRETFIALRACRTAYQLATAVLHPRLEVPRTPPKSEYFPPLTESRTTIEERWRIAEMISRERERRAQAIERYRAIVLVVVVQIGVALLICWTFFELTRP